MSELENYRNNALYEMKMTRGLFLDIRPTCILDITFSLLSFTVCSVTCKI